jgi:hypothetical protein
LTFDEEGVPIPSDPKNPIAVEKVEATVHFLYLDSPRLIASRKRKWRDTLDWIAEYRDGFPERIEDCTLQDRRRFKRHLEKLSSLTGPDTPFAATARASLRANGLAMFVQAPEEAVAA